MVVDHILRKFGYVRADCMKARLNFAHSVGKRLDEHREMVEAIEHKTSLFDDFWHIGHMATQDDYLMKLYYLVHDCWPHEARSALRENQPPGEHVRPRPAILGSCGLPEYSKVSNDTGDSL